MCLQSLVHSEPKYLCAHWCKPRLNRSPVMTARPRTQVAIIAFCRGERCAALAGSDNAVLGARYSPLVKRRDARFCRSRPGPQTGAANGGKRAIT